MARLTTSTVARKALGVIRLFMGSIALAMPRLLVSKFSESDRNATAATYAFRLFGVRTIVLGIELLRLKGADLDRVTNSAPVIHGSDTVAAFLAARNGKLPKRTGITLISISAANTVLSLIGRRR